MMKWVFGLMVILSVLAALFTGNISAVSNAALEEGANAVQFLLYLLGGMCVWGGIMRIADKAGLTTKLSKLFIPIARIVFKGINFKGKAFKAMTMNITANMLGLGNAATPLGMEAMRELEKEEKTTDTASDNMITFTVLNTASIQLIPTTMATLRLKYGSSQPLDIILCVLITSFAALFVAITLSLILKNLFPYNKKG